MPYNDHAIRLAIGVEPGAATTHMPTGNLSPGLPSPANTC